jgi:hypothetical protein
MQWTSADSRPARRALLSSEADIRRARVGTMFRRLTGALFVLAAGAALAQIALGEYVGSGGRGVLRITADKGDALRFSLNTVGGNFHIYELEGVIRKGEARMEESSHDKLPCIVTFAAAKQGIEVASRHQGVFDVLRCARAI